jgi:hypothetical protein
MNAQQADGAIGPQEGGLNDDTFSGLDPFGHSLPHFIHDTRVLHTQDVRELVDRKGDQTCPVGDVEEGIDGHCPDPDAHLTRARFRSRNILHVEDIDITVLSDDDCPHGQPFGAAS